MSGLLSEEICAQVLRGGVGTLDGGQEENQRKAKGLAKICQLLAGLFYFVFWFFF